MTHERPGPIFKRPACKWCIVKDMHTVALRRTPTFEEEGNLVAAETALKIATEMVKTCLRCPAQEAGSSYFPNLFSRNHNISKL